MKMETPFGELSGSPDEFMQLSQLLRKMTTQERWFFGCSQNSNTEFSALVEGHGVKPPENDELFFSQYDNSFWRAKVAHLPADVRAEIEHTMREIDRRQICPVPESAHEWRVALMNHPDGREEYGIYVERPDHSSWGRGKKMRHYFHNAAVKTSVARSLLACYESSGLPRDYIPRTLRAKV